MVAEVLLWSVKRKKRGPVDGRRRRNQCRWKEEAIAGDSPFFVCANFCCVVVDGAVGGHEREERIGGLLMVGGRLFLLGERMAGAENGGQISSVRSHKNQEKRGAWRCRAMWGAPWRERRGWIEEERVRAERRGRSFSPLFLTTRRLPKKGSAAAK